MWGGRHWSHGGLASSAPAVPYQARTEKAATQLVNALRDRAAKAAAADEPQSGAFAATLRSLPTASLPTLAARGGATPLDGGGDGGSRGGSLDETRAAALAVRDLLLAGASTHDGRAHRLAGRLLWLLRAGGNPAAAAARARAFVAVLRGGDGSGSDVPGTAVDAIDGPPPPKPPYSLSPTPSVTGVGAREPADAEKDALPLLLRLLHRWVMPSTRCCAPPRVLRLIV